MNSVLITGGTGTLGHGIVERLLALDTKRICILSRGEKAQSAMARKFGSDALRFFIGDVRDRWRLARAMDGCEVVIHAAALKRIDTCRYNPDECYETNVGGSKNVLLAATDVGVKKVVLVSTDKAFEPLNESPYGLSKAMAERFFLSWNETRRPSGPLFSGVRYGNVWGSNGSVVPLWRSILASAGRPKITDVECTRFFMQLQEAVDFVLGAVNQMRGGEIFVPHLPAYSVGDLVRALNIQSADFVGLPVYEKLHESMEAGNCSKDARRMSVEELRSHL